MNASVSVIIPCYQCVETITQAVDSIASQTMIPDEVFLIDDASSDGTSEMLLKIQSEYSEGWVKVIRLEFNHGASFARNVGWENSKSEYIAFLDSDDSWHPSKIELQLQWMMAHPDVDLSGHEISQVAPIISPYRSRDKNFSHTKITKRQLLLSNCLSTPTVMVKRKIIYRFDDTQYYAEDYLLWLSIICGGLNIFKLNLDLAYMYKRPYGESGLSQNLWAMEKGELKAYRKTYNSGWLRYHQYYLLCVYSLAKYVRRLILRALR